MRLLFRPALVVVGAIAVATCSDAPTAPRSPSPASMRPAQLQLAPRLSAAASQVASRLSQFGVTIDSVRIVLRRANGAVAVDTTIAVTPGQGSIAIEIPVTITGMQEQFGAQIQLLDGSEVMYEGTQTVTAVAAGAGAPPGPPPVIELSFTGPGARVASIRIVPRDSVFLTSARPRFGFVAVDSSGATVDRVVARWSTSDTALARVDENGALTPGTRRGAFRLRVETLTGIADELPVTLRSPAASVIVVSGGDQAGPAGRALPAPLVVEVRAADGGPAPGEVVRFAAANGGSVGAAEVTTGEDGRASTTIALGRALGAQQFTATVGTLPPATASARAVPGAPASITIVAGDGQAGTAGHPLAAPLVVRVADEFDHPVPDAVVAWSVTAGAGTPGAASSVTDAEGRASVSYTLGRRAGAESIRASVAGSLVADFTAAARAGAAARIAIVSGNRQSATAGTAAQPLVVRVADEFDNPVADAVVTWSRISGSGSPAAATSATDPNGVASLAYAVGSTAGAERVRAMIAAGASVEFEIGVTPGAASRIAKVEGDAQVVVAGNVVPVAPKVRVTDTGGNSIAGAAVEGSVSGPGLPTPVPFTATTDAAGTATLALPRPRLTGTYTATVQLTGVASAAVTFTLTVTPAPPAQLTLLTVPTGGTSGTPLVPQPVVQLRDSLGNAVPASGVTVTATVSGGASVSGNVAVTDASGVATFTNLTVTGAAGGNTLAFTAPGLAATSASVTLGQGPASTITILPAVPTAPVTVVAGSALPADMRLRVSDSGDNPVAGASVTAVIRAGTSDGEIVDTATFTTDASGEIHSSALGAAEDAGTYHVTFHLTGQPSIAVSFTAIVTPAAATAIMHASEPAATFTSGMTPRTGMAVRAVDTFGNAVPGATVTFSLAPGAGSFSGQQVATAVTDASGIAAAPPWTLPTTVGAHVLSARLGTGAAPVGAAIEFVTTIVAAPVPILTPVERVAVPAADTALATTTLAVRLADAQGQPIAGASILWTVLPRDNEPAADAAPIDRTLGLFLPDSSLTATSTTNAEGRAEVPFMLGTRAGEAVVLAQLAESPASASIAIQVHPGAPTALELLGEFQAQGRAGVALAPAPRVQLHDRHGNEVRLAGVPIAVRLAQLEIEPAPTEAGDAPALPAPPDGTCWVTPASALGVCTVTTDAMGRADFASVRLALVADAGPYQLVFESGDLDAVEAAVDVEAGPATSLELAPASTGAGHTIEQAPGATVTIVATARDVAGNRSNGQVIAWSQFASGEPAGTFSEPQSTTDAEGGATVNFTLGTTPGVRYVVNGAIGAVTAATDTFVVAAPAAPGMVVVGRPLHWGTAGEKRTLAVRVVRDDAPVAGATVAWTRLGDVTLDSASTTTDADGIARTTVTLGGSGPIAHRVRAALASDSTIVSELRLITTLQPATKVWLGAVDDDYDNPLNWAGDGSVPGILDDIFIPGWEGRPAPKLRTPRDVRGIETDNHIGGYLDIGTHELRIHGNIRVIAPIRGTGTGKVRILGAAPGLTAFAGIEVPTVEIAADVTIGGRAIFGGNVAIVSGGRLRLNGNWMTVGGAFTVNGPDAFLYSTVENSRLSVGGDFTIGSGYHGDKLTAGALEIGGNFAQVAGADTRSFQPAGTHVTRFVGAAPQVAEFANPGINQSRFNRLDIAKSGGSLELRGPQFVENGMSVSNFVTVRHTGGGAFSVAGGLTAGSQARLDEVPSLTLRGTSDFPLLGEWPPAELRVAGTVTATGGRVLRGDLVVADGGRLHLNGHHVTVTGDVAVTGSDAFLHSTVAGSALRVGGDFSIAAGYHGDKLTAGLLELGGNFTQAAGSDTRMFQASGSHVVKLVGSQPQAITFTNPGSSASRFAGLVIEKSGGTVTFGSDQHVTDLAIGSATAVAQPAGSFNVYGALTAAPGSDLSGVPLVTLFGTAAFPVFGGVPPGELVIRGARTLTVDSTAFPGNVAIRNGGRLHLGGKQLVVAGDLRVEGADAFLYSVDVPSTLHVLGDFHIAAGYHGDKLTNGTLFLHGDFTQAYGGDTRGFQANNFHTTWLMGTGDQTVTFANPDASASRFQTLIVRKESGGSVHFTSPVYVGREFIVQTPTTVTKPDGAAFRVGHNLLAVYGSDLSAFDTLTLVGGTRGFPILQGTPPRVLQIRAAIQVTQPAFMAGVVEVRDGGRLHVNDSLRVMRDVRVAGSDAFLYMTVASARLVVDSGFTIAAGYHGDKLTAGVLSIGGDFAQHYGSDTRTFQAVGDHVTRFIGTGAQSLVLSNSSDNGSGSRFHHLQVDKPAGTLTLSPHVFVGGRFDLLRGTVVQPGGDDLRVAGRITAAAGTSLAGVPWVTTVGTMAMPRVAGAAPGLLRIASDVTVDEDLTYPGPMVVANGGRLRLGGNRLGVTGDVSISGSDAFLYSTTAGDSLLVAGDFTAGGGYHGDKLTAGHLVVTGSFSQVYAGDTRSFMASGAHVTKLAGNGSRAISFQNPNASLTGYGASGFAHLQVEGTGQASFVTSGYVHRHLTVANNGKLSVGATSQLLVGGNLTLGTGGKLSVELGGKVEIGGELLLSSGADGNSSGAAGSIIAATCRRDATAIVVGGLTCPIF